MLSTIVSWRDRHELGRALPQLIDLAKLVGGDLTIVNYSGSSLLLQSLTASLSGKFQIVAVDRQHYFNKATAQNIGAAHTSQPVLFFCDCDIIVDPNEVGRLAEIVLTYQGKFATLAGVRESETNSRKANQLVFFGYELQLRIANGRSVHIKDNEEDGETGTRQAPGLLLVRRDHFLAVEGYNAKLLGWGWEDQDIICRLTLGLGLDRINEGYATHISHDDVARLSAYPPVSSRWESRDAMFRQALANYDKGNFLGTYKHDSSTLFPVTRVTRFGPNDQETSPRPIKTSSPKPKVGLVCSSRRSRISACLIVRDEERVLPRCLDSLVGVCDELCVVDTGSADSTSAVARDYQAKVRYFTECNGSDGMMADFSAARNAALELATGDWVLQIDADEILEAGASNIRRHVLDGTYDRIGFTICSEGSRWISGRLFRRGAATKYRNRIHEYIECSGLFLADPEIVVHNLPDKNGKESSRDRNIRLCLIAIQENPDDGRNYHYLGNEYRLAGLLNEAKVSYEKALRLGNFRLGLFHSAYYLAMCYLLQEDWEGAVRAGLEAVRIDPRYAEGHCFMGDVYSCVGNQLFARIWYHNALQCVSPPSDAVFPIQYWAYSEHPRKRLREIARFVH